MASVPSPIGGAEANRINLDVKPAHGDGLHAAAGSLPSNPDPPTASSSRLEPGVDIKPAVKAEDDVVMQNGAGPDACPPSPSAATKTANSTSTSAASTPAPNGSESPVTLRKKGRAPQVKKEKVKAEIQYIDHLPECTPAARATFEEMGESWYQNKSIGRTKQQEEMMICDCTWAPGDPPHLACSEASGCINYLTQVECIESECRCRSACQNQRFGRKQYAPIEIVQTDKKGFGVRAAGDISADSFVYEYVGEIVGERAFQKRMKDYADEGLQHFYFMQLQKDEYIDATKKGGLARFLNHSCSPNCYIAKWVVGRYLRMGIFTKRNVRKGEELTFNYNVDRYGHEPQVCHCGEPNCVGFLGGKTQTDVGAMDDLYLDALGITDDVELMSLKGTKSKKGRKMDIDYIPIMKPIPIKDVPKVASAIRQSCTNRRILSKLIRRIQITEEEAVRRQLMRLHGFSLMSMVLNEYLEDEEIVKTVMEILLKWPLITRNKLISTNIEETVTKLGREGSESVQTLANELAAMWVDLEVSYRIPKAAADSMNAAAKREAEDHFGLHAAKRFRAEALENEQPQVIYIVRTSQTEQTKDGSESVKDESPKLQPGWIVEDPDRGGRTVYRFKDTGHRQYAFPSRDDTIIQMKAAYDTKQAEATKAKASAIADVKDIVARARAEAEAAEAEAAARREAERVEAERVKAEKEAEKEAKRERARKRAEEKKKAKLNAHSRDKKIMRLFSEVVVKTMSRYKGALDHDQFKKRAREVTDILCQKEKKSSSYSSDPYDKLSPEKEAKVKTFVKDYTAKLLARKGLATPSSSSSHSRRPSSAASTDRPEASTPLTPAMSDSFAKPQTSPEAGLQASGKSLDNGASLYDDLDDVEVTKEDVDAELSDDEMEIARPALPTPNSTAGEISGKPGLDALPPSNRLSGTPPDLANA